MIGKSIGPYQIVDRLGGGGMGVVYKALDTRLERAVAVKVLPPHLSEGREEKQRFLQEARAASALDHPNICTVYEVGETADGSLYIAMAYCEGETLKERIARGPLDIGQAIHIALDVARGLERAHENGITHRDVKPANVIIGRRGETRIIDFGVAKLADGTGLTRTGSTVGTVSYMSPEQASGERVDHRTDIWSLGVILYEMLAGVRPFAGERDMAVIYLILNEDPKPLVQYRPDAPAELRKIVEHALTKKVAGRYQSMSSMADALQSLVTAVHPTASLNVSATRRPRAVPVVLAATAIVIATVAGAVWFTQRNTRDASTASPVVTASGLTTPPSASPPVPARADTAAAVPAVKESRSEPAARPAVHSGSATQAETSRDATRAAPHTSSPPAIVAAPHDVPSSTSVAESAATAAAAESALATERRAQEARLTQALSDVEAARAACPEDAAVFPAFGEATSAEKAARSASGDPLAAIENCRTATTLYGRAAADRAAAESEVRSLIEQYRAALEKKNISLLDALHTGFPPAERSKWEDFFAGVRNLRVTMTPGPVRFDGDGAGSTVGVVLNYDGAGGGPAAYEWRMRFVKSSDHWLVSRVDQTPR